MTSLLYINGDGGSRGNPGPAASAYVITDGTNVLHHESRFLGVTTNNVAEYTCVVMALQWVKNNIKEKCEIRFRLDSELVIRQLTGHYKVKSPHLIPLYHEVKSLLSSLPHTFVFESVPREENSLADKYVNEEMDRNLQ